MKRLSCAAIAIVAIFLTSVMVRGEAGQGEQQYVDVTGMAAIINNDIGAARDKALEDARRKAVEQVVGTMVDSETLVENSMLINDRIYSQTTGFICGDKITNETRDAYGNYNVTIHACVKQGNLEQDLLAIGICLRRIGNPRTMLMIAEQNMGEQMHGWWMQGSNLSIVEQKLMEEFSNKGFALIDPSVAQGQIRAVRAVGGEPDLTYAIQAGKAYDAEYVVIGKALVTCKSSNEQYSQGFYNCYANITTKIVKVDNARIIGSAAGSGKMAHIEANESGVRALQKASDDIAPKLIKALTMRCEKETGGGNEYKILVNNVGGLSRLKQFKDAVSGIRGVVSVTQRGYQGGSAELEVMYKGRAEDLADEIENKAGASVTNQSANTIHVRLK